MAQQPNLASPRFGQVRKSFWLFLAAVLLLALALPLSVLWAAASSPLRANACLASSALRVDGAAYVLVTLPDARDRDAVAGPWAHVLVKWDMVTMTMGGHSTVLSGAASHDGAFLVPLQVNMAGPWWVDIRMETPGRPDWHTHLQFSVLSAGTLSPVPTGQLPGAWLAPCGVRERTGSS